MSHFHKRSNMFPFDPKDKITIWFVSNKWLHLYLIVVCMVLHDNKEDCWLYDQSLWCTAFRQVVIKLGLAQQGSEVGRLVEWQSGLWKIFLFCGVCCWKICLCLADTPLFSKMPHLVWPTSLFWCYRYLVLSSIVMLPYSEQQLAHGSSIHQVQLYSCSGLLTQPHHSWPPPMASTEGHSVYGIDLSN